MALLEIQIITTCSKTRIVLTGFFTAQTDKVFAEHSTASCAVQLATAIQPDVSQFSSFLLTLSGKYRQCVKGKETV